MKNQPALNASMPSMVLGLDIGGTRCKLGRVDLQSGAVAAAAVFPTPREDEKSFYARIGEAIGRQAENARAEGIGLAGLGAGIGTYVHEGGILDSTCGFLPFLDHQPLAERLSEISGLPCRVANDTEAAARAEAVYGAGRGFSRSLTLTFGTGVGVGFTVDGQPQNRAADIHLAGHIMVRAGGEWGGCLDGCYCAAPGCLESTCSGSALGRLAENAYGAGAGGEALFDGALRGDGEANRRAIWFVDMLIRGLNQYSYIFRPDVMVLGGGVANGLAPWLGRLREGLAARVHTRHHPVVRLAALREMGGVIGAAAAFAP